MPHQSEADGQQIQDHPSERENSEPLGAEGRRAVLASDMNHLPSQVETNNPGVEDVWLVEGLQVKGHVCKDPANTADVPGD